MTSINDMRNRFRTLLVLAAAVLLASCSPDEMMTGSGPDGLVPVTLSAAVDDGVQTRVVSADEDESPTRCYVQAFTTADNGTTLTPAPGDLASPLDMGDPTEEGTFSLANVYLNPNETYVFLYWADNAEEPYDDFPDLRLAYYGIDRIAWAKRSEAWNYKTAGTAEISAELQHVVAKVTLKTTTNVEADSKITVTVPTTYNIYNVADETVIQDVIIKDTPFEHTVTNAITGTKEGTEVFSFYALVDGNNQDLTLANGTNSQKVSNVPLGPDMHTTLVGDVKNLGLTDVTFTANIEPTWSGTKEEIIGLEIADGGYTYIVSSPAALQAWATEMKNDASQNLNCTLAADIDLTEGGGNEWTPVPNFAGTFDGNNKTITGLTINQTATSNAGLFTSIIEGGTVKNLKLDKVNVTANSNVGAVAGQNKGTIENCSVSGNVTSSVGMGLSANVGGIVGQNNGTITGCTVEGSVKAKDADLVGGIVGYNVSGIITDCHSSATVEGLCRVGGIAGKSNASITACSSTGDVTATKNSLDYSWAGGVVGEFTGRSQLIACYATGNVKGDAMHVGGVVGDNVYGTVTACYHATGSVNGEQESTGGVVGRNFKDDFSSGILNACYWDGTATGDTGIGNDMTGNSGATKVEAPTTWETAMDAMNEALTAAGTGWLYTTGSGDVPLALQRSN